MADKNDSLTPSQILCTKGCGFFGSASTLNMCSKCFREYQRISGDVTSAAGSAPTSRSATPSPPPSATPLSPALSLSVPTPAPPAQPSVAEAPSASIAIPPSTAPSGEGATKMNVCSPEKASAAAPGAAEGAIDDGPPPRKIQKNTSRCFSCKTKIGLTGFKCKCGYTFCSKHRMSSAHDCDYDYRAEQRMLLEKNNPIVKAAKLDKI